MYKIIQRVGVLSTDENGNKKEFNITSFDGNEPMYDVRMWSADHAEMGEMTPFTKQEAELFASMVANLYFDKKEEKQESKVIQFKPKVKVEPKPKIKLPF